MHHCAQKINSSRRGVRQASFISCVFYFLRFIVLEFIRLYWMAKMVKSLRIFFSIERLARCEAIHNFPVNYTQCFGALCLEYCFPTMSLQGKTLSHFLCCHG